jgi:hypothetical protein
MTSFLVGLTRDMLNTAATPALDARRCSCWTTILPYGGSSSPSQGRRSRLRTWPASWQLFRNASCSDGKRSSFRMRSCQGLAIGTR